jgi:hypothetical protein
MKTKKNIKKLNNSKSVKNYVNHEPFSFLNKNHINIIQQHLNEHNSFNILEILVSKFAKPVKDNILQSSIYDGIFYKKFMEKIRNQLHLEDRSKKFEEYKSKYSYFLLTILTKNKNKIKLLIEKNERKKYLKYDVFLYQYNTIIQKPDEDYNVILNINCNIKNEIYIANINKNSQISGSKAVEIALEICKLFSPKTITIYDAAKIEEKSSKSFNPHDDFDSILMLSKRNFLDLSLSRLLSKDIYDLSWYNSFGFNLNSNRMKDGVYDKEKIKKDIQALRNLNVSSIYDFVKYMLENKHTRVCVTEYSFYFFDYEKSLDEKLKDLFENLGKNKDKSLTEFYNNLSNKNKSYFLNLFLNKYHYFIGFFKNRKFIKSPFFNYLYILRYIGENREMKLD